MRDDLGKWMIETMGEIHLSEASKKRLVNTLKSRHSFKVKEDNVIGKKWFKKTTVLAFAAACAFILAVAASATVLIAPIIRDYYGNSAGYHQISLSVGKSITRNGWTMTLTDCIADDYNLYAGIELSAPAGTILNAERGYHFENYRISFPNQYEIGAGSYCKQVENEDCPDNVLRFVFQHRFSMEGQDLDGKTVSLTFDSLYHITEWNEQAERWARDYDCKEAWSFQVDIAISPDIIRRQPNIPVTTLGVEALITNIEVSPIGVYVYIEGDSLKGHHSWVPMNAPDGWYGCVEYQDVILRFKDGNELSLIEGMEGAGCSGGTDTTEPGYLHLARRSEKLIDMATVQSLSICGVDIPLR